MDITAYIAERRAPLEAALSDAIACDLGGLEPVMRYSLMAGGKRLRPILVLAAAEAVGGSGLAAMPVAVAFEMVHTQSLIYDDLPCMDDDDLRRGQPTAHRAFGEAMALLAGNALIGRAFELIAKSGSVPAEKRLAAAAELATATRLMCLGQHDDLVMAGSPATSESLHALHRHKTGALIAGALRAGGWVGGGTETQVAALGRFGLELGLAFQIVDDLLDVSATAAELGKTPGKDAAADKATFPKVFGLDQASHLGQAAGARAIAELAIFGPPADPLRGLVDVVLERRS